MRITHNARKAFDTLALRSPCNISFQIMAAKENTVHNNEVITDWWCEIGTMVVIQLPTIARMLIKSVFIHRIHRFLSVELFTSQ